MKHFLSMKDFSEHEILRLIKLAEELAENPRMASNQPLFAANLFFEPSTRTKMSFTIAQRKLGIEVLDFFSEFSSTKKGESVYDTARTFEALGASLLVVRHPQERLVDQLAQKLSIPIINAGDGKGEHPTQCLLDLLTIHQEFQSFRGLKVVIAGDIVHSRVARSNAYALNMLGAEVYLASKPEWMDESLPYPYISIDEAVEFCDVVMLLRIQHERHESKMTTASDDYLTQYGLTKERESRMKPGAVILHPAPINRGVEIDSDLVESSKSRIFKQMENGVSARMAVMASLLEDRGIFHADAFNKREAISR